MKTCWKYRQLNNTPRTQDNKIRINNEKVNKTEIQITQRDWKIEETKKKEILRKNGVR